MKRFLLALSLAMFLTASIPVATEASTVQTTQTRKSSAKKSTPRKKATRVIGTFKLHDKSFQMLPGGKIKCTTDPSWEGTYEKKYGFAGYSVHSPRVDWCTMELWNKNYDGVEYYIIYDTDKTTDIHFLGAASVELEITFDPIFDQVSIAEVGEGQPETKDLSDFKKVGTVKGLYKK